MKKDFNLNRLATTVMWWLSYTSAVGRKYVLSESAIKFPVAEYLLHTMASPQEGRQMSRAGLLIALGFIFGDIGTSPLYVFKAIIGNDHVSRELIYGSVSCIFWTFLFITTFKYVYLALKADNRGEGGIFEIGRAHV